MTVPGGAPAGYGSAGTTRGDTTRAGSTGDTTRSAVPADGPARPGVPRGTADGQWHRLDPRTLAVFPLKQAGALIPLLVVVLIGGRHTGGWQLFAALCAPALLVLVGSVRWATFRYRVSAERVELRHGLLRRQERSLRRDRVRTVDLRSTPLHRVFGLTVVEIGTGSSASRESRLTLDAVAAPAAERLRRGLLDRASAAGPVVDAVPTGAPGGGALPPGAGTGRAGPSGTAEPGSPTPDRAPAVPATAVSAPATAEGPTVARLRPGWLRFAPLTMSGLVAVGAIVATSVKVAGDLGVNLADPDNLRRADSALHAVPPSVVVGAGLVAVLLVGGLGSLVIYVEGWWGYRLTREPDGTLHLRRGLLTTRSLSIEQRRMRGAEVTEPLPLRLASGARCAAITTGLDARSSSGGALLLPPAPRAEAHRVAREALLVENPEAATRAELVRHPPAALRRRLTRTVLPAAVLTALAWWAAGRVPALEPLWPAALLVLPAAALLAADRYRNLGHALRPAHLVIGQGSLVRRRVALQRRGIIGWRIRQSPTQRWAGLVTLDAVTAAGAGHYSVVDVPLARAVELVETVNPGLLPVG
ncbi:MAG TPA: PH domain-containing protein [Pseudonocardia sp.]|jgi:putative membrane protein